MIEALIKAVRAGELDEQLNQSTKLGRPMPARKVALAIERSLGVGAPSDRIIPFLHLVELDAQPNVAVAAT